MTPLGRAYVSMGVAIVAEVIATSALTASHGFSKWLPSVTALGFYGVAFWLLSLALLTVPTGIVYAIWSGVGIVLITAVSWVWFRQALDAPALIGLGLIVAG